MPLVSVILPAFNRVQFLRLAVESVCAQTLADWEMLIADDGSADETRGYLRSISDPRIRTIWLTHSGNPSRVRNAAIKESAGRYLAFLDSDDVWAPAKLEKQTAVLRADPERRWSYTACDRIDERGCPVKERGESEQAPTNGPLFKQLLTLETSIAMPTVVAERRLIEEIGGFDEAQLYGEFHDLCVRLALRSDASYLTEALCSIRAHAEHYSANRVAAYESWIGLYAKMATLAPDPVTRACCQRMRARASLTLAGLQDDKGDRRAVWATLGTASTFSWRYPDWWFGALKRVARPLLPKHLVSMYKQRQR